MGRGRCRPSRARAPRGRDRRRRCRWRARPAQRGERLLQLRDHSARDDAVGDGALAFCDGQARDARRRVVDVAQDAGRAGDEHERVGLQRAGELVGDDVGVDVVDGAVAAVAEAGDDRELAAVENAVEQRADRSRRRRRRGRSRSARGRRRRRRAAVACARARCRGARRDAGPRRAARAQVDVDLAGDDHLHDVERRRVGDAAAADHARLEPELLRQRRRLRPAAVRRRRGCRRRRARARSRASSASFAPPTTSPPSLTTTVVPPVAPRSRPRARILERRPLVEAEHEVHALDRLAGAALDEVVARREAGDEPLAGAADRARHRPRSRPRRSSSR